jgi:uncharacterized protein with GYD domain
MKLTDRGAKDIKNTPQRIEQAIKAYEKMGDKMLRFYTVTRRFLLTNLLTTKYYSRSRSIFFALDIIQYDC